jgi:hypothetical protein
MSRKDAEVQSEFIIPRRDRIIITFELLIRQLVPFRSDCATEDPPNPP